MAGWWKLQSCLDEADPEQQHKGQPAVVADAPHHHSDKGIHIPRGGGSGCAAKVSLDSASLGLLGGAVARLVVHVAVVLLSVRPRGQEHRVLGSLLFLQPCPGPGATGPRR